MQYYEKDAPAAVATPPRVYHLKEEPAQRYQSTQTEVAIPTLQALIPSAAWGMLAGILAGGVVTWQRWPWYVVPVVGLVVCVGLFAWSVTRRMQERRDLLWKREQLERRDLDGDGAIGDPQTSTAQEPRFVYVQDNRRQARLQAANDFRFFLREAYNGRGTTWRKWKGAKLPSGRDVTRPTWENYCGRLIKAGLGTREYDTAPVVLTSDYRQALAAFADAL
jgi:hypothetical protein